MNCAEAIRKLAGANGRNGLCSDRVSTRVSIFAEIATEPQEIDCSFNKEDTTFDEA